MDWKSNKKIKKYLKIYLIFLVLFSVFMLALAKYESRLNSQRMLVLMEHHPELEAELVAAFCSTRYSGFEGGPDGEVQKNIRIFEEKYGYRMEKLASAPFLWVFWAAGLIFGALFILFFGIMELRKSGQGADSGGRMQEIYECLERFRSGEFTQIPDPAQDSGEWMKLCESLRELGAYFSQLKQRLWQEENNTKALVTDISHQLKTPLAALKMSHELAAGSGLSQLSDFSPEEKQEFFKQEWQEIEKLELLVGELVKLSRLEANMIQLKPVPTGIKGTLASAISRIYMKAKNKNIEIQMEAEKDIPVSHDPKWTEEAFVNVLDNAVKYSGGHTTVTVRIIQLAYNVLVEIEDEGIGIQAEELTKIYQRFYRGAQVRQKVKEGAGVGLYLVRMILERQGGTISAKRKMGRGTVFKITLPLKT